MNTIIMTGGTSGLGEVTAKRLTNTPDTQLLMGGRATSLPLELSSLSSVRQFARHVLDTLGETKINALVLNAGLSFPTDARTVDGYETTFAANHLGHYLLLRMLTPALARDAIVVLTTSNTHDPMFSPVAPFPFVDAQQLAHLDLEQDAQGGATFESGFRAYATSKLCNLLTARAFAASSEARPGSCGSSPITPATFLAPVWGATCQPERFRDRAHVWQRSCAPRQATSWPTLR